MKLRLIPPGEFSMGAPDAGDSMIPHHVRITRPFYLGVFEVIWGGPRSWSRSPASGRPLAEQDRGGWRLENSKQRSRLDKSHQYTWRAPGFAQDDTHPVDVSWADMQTFCELLSRQEGRKYRLPTEAEWEYAARAGTTHWNYNGGDSEEMTEIGNIPDKTAAARFPGWKEQTCSVGRLRLYKPRRPFSPERFRAL